MSAYGDQSGEDFRLRTRRNLVSRTVGQANIGITELRCETSNWGMTNKIEPEDAFVVALELRDYSGDIWLDGKNKNIVPINRGQIAIYDLKVDTRAYLRTPFHCLQIYLPTTGLNSLLANSGRNFDRNLNCALASPIDDPVWMQAASLMMPALQAPDQANQLFLDHLSLALAAHFSSRYGSRPTVEKLDCGGLSPWQLRLATELITSRLGGTLSISEMADACGLTSTYFSRAFKHSMGLPPHQWLLVKRVEKAQKLIETTSMTLLEIAHACGFSDQSHFARVFTRYYGVTPSSRRREKMRLTPTPFRKF
jgi:AraC family transcriptional regulator